MTTNNENSQPNSQLTLYDSSNSPLAVREADLILTKQESQFVEARLTFSVELELYQHIDTQALFNLKPEVRTFLTDGDFQPNSDIQISASLKPDLLSLLLEKIPAENLTNTSQQQVSVPLESIAQTQTETSSSPIHPLLVTENWLALSVRQIQASQTTGYHTLWSYINPTALFGTNPNSEEIARGIANFFQDTIGNNLDTIAEEFSTQTVEAFSNLFSELYAEPSDEKASQESSANSSIFDTMLEFFTQDGWTFFQVENQPALQLDIEATNGRWTCYAAAYEEQQQMVFYSLCPINTPASKRQALAEFLTKTNYGQIIGNFELDMEDGEIRYKTSIDVAGSTLTLPQIKNLVYTNITMMDTHLPEILSVINNSPSPLDAIPIKQTPSAPNFYSKNSNFSESKQIAINPEKEQELDDSLAVSQVDRENTAVSLPSRSFLDVETSQELESDRESEQEIDDFSIISQVDRENTAEFLTSRSLLDIESDRELETIQESDRELDNYQTFPQIERENIPRTLPDELLEDGESDRKLETIYESEQELDDFPTASQTDRENNPPFLPEERSEEIEYDGESETARESQQELDDSQTVPQVDQENTPLPSPDARLEFIEYKQQIETEQEKKPQLHDVQTHSNCVWDVGRTPSRSSQDNPLTTTLTEQQDPTEQPEKFTLQTDILSDLTEEETANFESAMQLVKAGKINAAKTILAEIKNNLSSELGEEGEQIFHSASHIFQLTNLSPANINELNGYNKILPPNVQNIIPVLINPKLKCNSIKIDCDFAEDGLVSQIYLQVGDRTAAKELKSYFGKLKQIYRYWDISSQLKPLLQRIKSISKEQLKRSTLTTRDTLRAAERLPASIQTRLLQLATEKLESQLELDILIEINELQELLAKTKRILNTEFL